MLTTAPTGQSKRFSYPYNYERAYRCCFTSMIYLQLPYTCSIRRYYFYYFYYAKFHSSRLPGSTLWILTSVGWDDDDETYHLLVQHIHEPTWCRHHDVDPSLHDLHAFWHRHSWGKKKKSFNITYHLFISNLSFIYK